MADEIKLVEGKYLEYKGRPLVREGDTICYGDMDSKCILILEIISHRLRSLVLTEVLVYLGLRSIE